MCIAVSKVHHKERLGLRRKRPRYQLRGCRSVGRCTEHTRRAPYSVSLVPVKHQRVKRALLLGQRKVRLGHNDSVTTERAKRLGRAKRLQERAIPDGFLRSPVHNHTTVNGDTQLQTAIVQTLVFDLVTDQYLTSNARTRARDGIRQCAHVDVAATTIHAHAHVGSARVEHDTWRVAAAPRLVASHGQVGRVLVFSTYARLHFTMSFGRPPTFSTFQVSPPERVSFPLDHEGTLLISSNAGDCTAPMREYLACLKVHKNNNGECRHLSKAYLQCRMDKCVVQRMELMQWTYGARQYGQSWLRRRRQASQGPGEASAIRADSVAGIDSLWLWGMRRERFAHECSNIRVAGRLTRSLCERSVCESGTRRRRRR